MGISTVAILPCQLVTANIFHSRTDTSFQSRKDTI